MPNSFDALRQVEPVRQSPVLEDYLDHICLPLVKHVSYEERMVIRTEMRTHIEWLIQAHTELGCTESEAVNSALVQFGDPNRIGNAVLKAHMPTVSWLTRHVLGIAQLGMGAATGAALFVGLDGFTNLLHLTTNICVGPDCVIGAALGWLPAMWQMKRPCLPTVAARRFAGFYGAATGCVIFAAALASNGIGLHPWKALCLLSAAVGASVLFGAVAGALVAHGQRSLSKRISNIDEDRVWVR